MVPLLEGDANELAFAAGGSKPTFFRYRTQHRDGEFMWEGTFAADQLVDRFNSYEFVPRVEKWVCIVGTWDEEGA